MTYVKPKVTKKELEPFIGRLVKIVTVDDDHVRTGFISAIRRGQVILDEYTPISLSKIVAVYNIVSMKIAGEGPEEYVHGDITKDQ